MENNSNLPENNSNESNDSGSRAGLASRIDSIISSPTDAVRSRHSHSTSAANTGTNVIYEGQTAPGGGGSVGTGEASGQSATGQSITTDGAYEAAQEGTNNHPESTDSNTENLIQKDHDDALDRSTLGTP